mgnify:CR=1 FL=1
MIWLPGYPPFLFTASGLLTIAGVILMLPLPRLDRVFLLPISLGVIVQLVLAVTRQRFWPGLVPAAAVAVLLFCLGLARVLAPRPPGPPWRRPLGLPLIALALLPAWLAAPPGLEPGPGLSLGRINAPDLAGNSIALPTLVPLPEVEASPQWLRFLIPQDGRGTLPALALPPEDVLRETGVPGWLGGHLRVPSGRLRPGNSNAFTPEDAGTWGSTGTVFLVLPAGHVWQGYRSLAARLVSDGKAVVFLQDAGAEIGGVEGLLLPDGSALSHRLVAEIGLDPSPDAEARARESLLVGGDASETVAALLSGIPAAARSLEESIVPPIAVAGLAEGAIAAAVLASTLGADHLLLVDPAPVLALPPEARRAALSLPRVSVVYPAIHAPGNGLLGSLPGSGMSAVVLGARPGGIATSEPLLLPAPWERISGTDPRIGTWQDRAILQDLVLTAFGVPGTTLDRWRGSDVLLDGAD